MTAQRINLWIMKVRKLERLEVKLTILMFNPSRETMMFNPSRETNVIAMIGIKMNPTRAAETKILPARAVRQKMTK
jgi:hypothetical protein